MTKAPTTNATGILTGTCSRCNATTTVTLPKLNTTDYTYSVTKAATCTATGTGRYTWKTTTYGTFYFDVTIAKISHTYKDTVTAPTCTAQGYTTHTCSVCGDSYKDTYTAALGHNYSYAVTTKPTASTTGVLTGTCSRCNATTTVTLPKLNTTDYIYSVTKAATCTATGTGRYTWKTTTYGTFYFDVAIAKISHTYKDTVTAPTCTAQGYTTHTCSLCGDSYKDTYTAALGHNYSYAVTTKPTASTTGVLTGTCSRCNATTTVTLPKLNTTDYTYSVTKAATCTTTGTGRYTWKATTYGTFYFDVTIAKISHTYKDTVTAPTCTAQGYTTHTCDLCGDSYVDSYVNALGHNYGAWTVTKAATCTAAGTETRTCSRCGSKETRTVAALGHAESDWIIDRGATCTASGSKHTECTRCGVTMNTAAIAAKGHTESGWITDKAPTCTASGTKHTECTVCGAAMQTAVIAALGHDYKNSVTAPTCTARGYTTHTCSRCGDSFTNSYVDALGHDWGALTYAWSADNGTVTATRVCKREESHAEAETVKTSSAVTKEATYDAEGEITYTATFENAAFATQTKTVKTPKLDRPDEPTPGLPCGGGDTCPGKGFTDMPAKGNWAHDAIDWAIVNKITSGTSATTFSPNAGCTRGQVVTFLWRAAGCPEPTSSNNPFKDVKSSAYYYNAVLWAVEKGITAGTGKTAFSPEATCTRAQIVTFLWRFEGKPEPNAASNPFKDVKSGDYFETAVLWAAEAGVTSGTSNTAFSPNATCTRAQVVSFLYRDLRE